MPLPLIDRARRDGVTFVLTPRLATPPQDGAAGDPRTSLRLRMPDRPLEAGEQYRFHFDMSACIGCKCCVVACNEQNGNPASINWRRVGEMEGGVYPGVQRTFLSMACNHCLEPTCLAGCPVDAYTKDPVTGIVRHSADTCIGCEYCTWNCSYGVPQFDPERGVVGKCDMCHGRLERDQAPACVSACPEGAIRIEIVQTSAWRDACASGSGAGGAPISDHSLSTTRVTLPERLPSDARPVDLTHVRPQDAHWPLVVMTVLTQLAVGAFTSIWLLQLSGRSNDLGLVALASLIVSGLALGSSTLHLGRPIHAYRALKMWRRSWLSREVLLFAVFSAVAGLYAALLWFGSPGQVIAGGLTAIAGAAGVTATACIYRVPSRPSWHTPLTLAQFIGTGCLLGPLFTLTIGAADAHELRNAVLVAAGLQLLLVALWFLRSVASDRVELRGTARLLSTTLAVPFIARGVLLVVGGIVLPLSGADPLRYGFALVLAGAGEIIARYLFFVSVVPTHMAAPYLSMGREAA